MASDSSSYRFFDFHVSSEVPLVELPAAEIGGERFHIQIATTPVLLSDRDAWDWQWRLPSGRVFLAVARDGEDCLLQFPGVLDAVYRPGRKTIELSPTPGTSDEIVRHLLLDHLLPRLVSHQGRLVLHAGAVGTGEGAILFLGQTGAGKSTMVASFLDDGFELLTDDCVLLEPHENGFRAIPAYPGLRLWSDSLTEMRSGAGHQAGGDDRSWKHRVALARDPSESSEIQAILILEEPNRTAEAEEIQVEPVAGSGALVELLKHGFLLDPSDRGTIERQFLAVGELAEALPLFRVCYPRQYSELPRVRQAIIRRSMTERSD